MIFDKGAASEEIYKEYRHHFDLPNIAELWRRGSVVGSWLLDLTAMALREDPALSHFTGSVQDSGEGRRYRAAVSRDVLNPP